MADIIKNNRYKRLLTSKDNIIIDVNKDFLGLTGYNECELVGKTLAQADKVLRIDSQVNLHNVEDVYNLYVFTNGGLAIDITITCQSSIKEGIKNFYFKENIQFFLRNMLLNFDDFSISNKQALAVYSYPDYICLKTNEKYMNSLHSIDFASDSPIGKPYPYPRYTSRLMEEDSFYEDEVKFTSLNETETYWDMSMRFVLVKHNCNTYV